MRSRCWESIRLAPEGSSGVVTLAPLIVGSHDTSRESPLRNGWADSSRFNTTNETGIWFRVFWPHTGKSGVSQDTRSGVASVSFELRYDRQSHFARGQDRPADRPNSRPTLSAAFSTVSSIRN